MQALLRAAEHLVDIVGIARLATSELTQCAPIQTKLFVSGLLHLLPPTELAARDFLWKPCGVARLDT
jgi:hypothetical protein